jgi:hypothetical protein
MKVRTLTGENRYGWPRRFSGFAGNQGKFFNNRWTADRTGTYAGVSPGYGKRVILTAWKTAGAAVGPGQGFTNLSRKGILRHGKEFLKKP